MKHTVCRNVGKARLPNPLGGPQDHKVQALLAIEAKVESGLPVRDAVEQVAGESGIGVRTLFNYRKKTNFVPRDQWAETLSPRWKPPVGPKAIPHPTALALFVDLCRQNASVSACYQQVCREANNNDWGVMPSERTFRRVLESLVSKGERHTLRRNAQTVSGGQA